jgi:hypothetical protein
METIIGLLFILLPVIFKLIGKRFEQSGNQDKARKVREIAQALDGEDSPMHDWKYFGEEILGTGDKKQASMVEAEQPRLIEVVSAQVMAEPIKEGKPAFVRKPMLVEEEEKHKGEKIDPKKLVIYSEIMKPKF